MMADPSDPGPGSHELIDLVGEIATPMLTAGAREPGEPTSPKTLEGNAARYGLGAQHIVPLIAVTTVSIVVLSAATVAVFAIATHGTSGTQRVNALRALADIARAVRGR